MSPLNICNDNKLKMNIFELISSRNWKKLRAHVFIHKESVSLRRSICSQSCNSKHNFLQYACRYHPPLDVVKCILRADPTAISDQEYGGKQALHIACEQGCSPTVIKYLLKKYPKAAEKLDKDERSPFLLACKSYLLKSNKSSINATKDLLEVLKMLSAVAPVSLMREDCYGMSGLEFLLEHEVDMHIISYVQLTSMDIREEMDSKASMLTNNMDQLDFEKNLNKKQQDTETKSNAKIERESIISRALAA